MISNTNTTTSSLDIIASDGMITNLEALTLISDSSSTTSGTSTTSNDHTLADLEAAIQDLEDTIVPLATKTQKKLSKVEKEIANCNFLIDSGIGSKKDQAELRKNKRQLRQRRIKLWDELKPLPALKEEKVELERQLKALRRQLGVVDDDI